MMKKNITVKANHKDSGIPYISQTPIISSEEFIKRPKLNSSLYSVFRVQELRNSSIKKRTDSNYKFLYLKENYIKNYKKLSPVLNEISFTTPDELTVDSPFLTSFSLKSSAHISQAKEIKSFITRIAKFNILQMKKQSLQEKLKDKNRRFKLRQRKTV